MTSGKDEASTRPYPTPSPKGRGSKSHDEARLTPHPSPLPGGERESKAHLTEGGANQASHKPHRPSNAKFSLSTFTRASPNTPNCLPVVAIATIALTCDSLSPRTRATRPT